MNHLEQRENDGNYIKGVILYDLPWNKIHALYSGEEALPVRHLDRLRQNYVDIYVRVILQQRKRASECVCVCE